MSLREKDNEGLTRPQNGAAEDSTQQGIWWLMEPPSYSQGQKPDRQARC